jgi:hypothetical protein
MLPELKIRETKYYIVLQWIEIMMKQLGPTHIVFKVFLYTYTLHVKEAEFMGNRSGRPCWIFIGKPGDASVRNRMI